MTLHTRRKVKQAVGHTFLHLFFILLCFATLIPILYAVSVSFNADNSLLSSNFRFIPEHFTLDNYIAVFTEDPVMLWFKNTLILAVSTVAICLVVSVPASYVFSRKRFRGRKPILKILVLLYSFPSVLSMFAIYRLLSPMGLVDSKLGLILIYTGTMAEFGLLNMKGYFDTIPLEIEEAAKIDGCTEFMAFWRVVFPLLGPCTASLIVLNGLGIWNDFLMPYLALPSDQAKTITVAVYSFVGQYTARWDIVFAGTLISLVPALIIYVCLQKYFVKGIMSGAAKG